MTDASPLTAALAGRYRIGRELGEGGMATVFLAEDLRHHRQVAIKVLRHEISASLGSARFVREIEIAAQLQHPHILPLLDSGEAGGSLFYVMPYVDGQSLRQRLARDGPFKAEEAARLLAGVADALAYAHARGVVHRDIKPDNIMLSGRHALVADFGVAKAVSEATGRANITTLGIALGTPAYMSPEQASADPAADHRSDIYAVGALAYELLTGRPPFIAASPAKVLAAQITEMPEPLSKHAPGIPAGLERVVLRCLEKNPGDRWQTADELMTQLELYATPSGGTTPAQSRPFATRALRRNAAIAAALLLAAGAGASIAFARRGPAPLILGRQTQVTSDAGLEVQPAISPDGRYVAYAAGFSARMRVLARPVDGGRTIALTDDSTQIEWAPRWSPDGARILFLSRNGVYSAPAFGGAAHPEVRGVAAAPVVAATWSPDGKRIAYLRSDSLRLRTLGTGDEQFVATGGDLHSCSMSPDGLRFACVSGNTISVTVGRLFGNISPSRIVLIPVGGGERVTVTDSTAANLSPIWTPDGRRILFLSSKQGRGDVYALAISSLGRAAGSPERLTTGLGARSISLSADGTRLAYSAYEERGNIWSIPIATGAPLSSAQLVPVTRGHAYIEGVRVSADGRWLLYDSNVSGNSDIYRIPVSGGEPERLTTDSTDEFRGELSPDGKELAFHSWRTGSRDIFVMPLDGGPTQQVTSSPNQEMVPYWSPDGEGLVFFDFATRTIWVVRRDASGRWGAPRQRAEDGWWAHWAPDGRSIAFTSPTTGAISIVDPDSGAPRLVYAPAPGAPDPPAETAVLSPDGRTFYFKSHDAAARTSFWSLPVTGGRPRLLARLDDPARQSNRVEFDSDGKRFFFVIEEPQSDIWLAAVMTR